MSHQKIFSMGTWECRNIVGSPPPPHNSLGIFCWGRSLKIQKERFLRCIWVSTTCVKILIFPWSHWTFFHEGGPLLHVSNISFYCYHLSYSLWLLVKHLKHLHRVINFLRHFGDICGPFFWTLWGVWTRILYGLQFLQRERRMHSGIFQICKCSFTSSKCFFVFWLALVNMCIAKQWYLCVSLSVHVSPSMHVVLHVCL